MAGDASYAGGSPVFGARPGGGGGGGAKFLSSIYAAGVADNPTTDNLFGMQLGTSLRFQANSDANALPEVGLYEGTAAQAVDTSGSPAVVESLATTLATLIGGRVFNAYQMFDPTWNGQWNKLDAYSWTVETISFVNAPQTKWTIGTNAAARSYQAAKNYSPEGLPFVSGSQDAAFHQLFLYNGVDGFARQVDRLDGYGQMTRRLAPVNPGVTYQWQTRFARSPNVGDGTGWGIFQANGFGEIGDPPNALLKTYLTSDGTTWGWGLSSKQGAAEFDIATFEQQAITFNAPVKNFGGGIVPQMVASADVDLLSTGVFPVTPSLPGFYGPLYRTALVVTQQTGAITAGPTVTMGNNGTFDNFSSSNTIPASQFVQTPPTLVQGPLLNVTNGNTMLDLTSPISVHITAGATGPTVLKGKFIVWLAFVPVAVFT